MSKRFSKINIEISNICNLQCSFCPEVVREKKLMSTDLFRKIILQVTPLTEQVCLHLMGEPLVHPKLSEIVEICQQFNVKIFLVTNGILLKEKNAQLLLHPIFRQVNFSLHSFHDNFPKLDANDYLARIFQYTEQAFQNRPDLYLNYRLWNLQDPKGTSGNNQEMIKKIADYFQIQLDLNIDIRNRKSLHLKNRLYLHFDTEFTWPSLDLPILGTKGSCYGLRSHFGILVDGTIVPCCLDKEASIPLGNIQDQEIVEILNSPRAKNIFEGFRQKKLIENLCQRCQYIERFSD